MTNETLHTDYLVVGAGINGLSFVDELLTRTTASITIVDKRDAPGGHWNDSYPFVKLHQPSHFYGVESTVLGDHRIDDHGPNKGFMSLATGSEVIAYCHALMRDRFLPSGRVTFIPLTEYQSDGSLRGLISGKLTTVTIRKRLVDASWYDNQIPLNHTPSFSVDTSVTCIPPNSLPQRATDFERYTIIGAGKTAMDSCLWLLTNGANPNQLRWIIPHDYWFYNRAKVQTDPAFFFEVFNGFIARKNAIAEASNAMDLALRFEKNGLWLRLDQNVDTHMFHAAVLSTGEVKELRTIRDVVRKGYLKRIESSQLILTAGSITASTNTLYIDCSASAIPPRPLVPVFQPGKIVLQLIQFPSIPFSAALTAVLESLSMDDSERNNFVVPISFKKTIDDFVSFLPTDLQNQARQSQHPQVREWVKQSRLEGYSRIAHSVQAHETEKIKVLKHLREASLKALKNVSRLAASTKQQTKL